MAYTIRTQRDGEILDTDTATDDDTSTYYPTAADVAYAVFESRQIVLLNENTPLDLMGTTVDLVEDSTGNVLASHTFA